NTHFSLELATGIMVPANATRPELSYSDHFDIAASTTLSVEVTVDDGLTWQTVMTYTAVNNRPDWVLRRVPLNAYTGQNIRVRVRASQGSATYRDHWYLDDVRLGEHLSAEPSSNFPFSDNFENGVSHWEP